jgi:hypothetical protein
MVVEPMEWRFREGEAGRRVGVRMRIECPSQWGGEGAREAGEGAGMVVRAGHGQGMGAARGGRRT